MLWCNLSYAKIRNMKWLLRRFCTIRGFLYVSMRFYTLGILHEIFEHESHELNEFFIAHGSHGSHGSYTRIFLNTNNPNNTNIFWHTDLTDHTDLTLEFFEHEIRRRPTDRREVIIRITRIIFVHADLTLFNAHGSHRSHGFAYASHGSRMSFFELYYKSKNPIEAISRRLKDP